MKRIITLATVGLLTAASAFAQGENPHGLYKLQRLGYENGRPDHVPELTQYKYFSDFVPVTIMLMRNTPQEYIYVLKQDEPHPYVYTGDVPVGEDGRGTRIYGTDSNHVTVKWYNTIRPGNGDLFPMNQFITEYYDRNGFEQQMQRSIEMLQQKHKQPNHRLAGCWHLVGNYKQVEGERVLTSAPTDVYKIYGDKDVTCLFCRGDQIMGATILYRSMEYKPEKNDADTAGFSEGGSTGNDGGAATAGVIKWKSNDSFEAISMRPDETVVEELWKRAALPEAFQKLFGTQKP